MEAFIFEWQYFDLTPSQRCGFSPVTLKDMDPVMLEGPHGLSAVYSAKNYLQFCTTMKINPLSLQI